MVSECEWVYVYDLTYCMIPGEPNASGEQQYPGVPPEQVEILFADGGFYRCTYARVCMHTR